MFFGHHTYGKYDSILKLIFSISSFSPRINISNNVSCVSNDDSMPKSHPQEIETPIYPKEAHTFGASSPRVRFLDV